MGIKSFSDINREAQRRSKPDRAQEEPLQDGVHDGSMRGANGPAAKQPDATMDANGNGDRDKRGM